MGRPYITNENAMWFIFGTHHSGYVDVSCADGDIVTNISKEVAEQIIKAHNEYVNRVEKYILGRKENA